MRSSSWVEVSAEALRHNLRALTSMLAPGTLMAPVVKANAYGHGLALASQIFSSAGADWFCVNDLDEAETLGQLDLGRPVYVVGPTMAEHAARTAKLGCDVVCSTEDHLRALSEHAAAMGSQVGVHIKVDTGTHRQGARPAEARRLAALADTLPGLRLAGITTHFADVEDETQHTFAQVQLERFNLAAAGLPTSALRHCASSAAHLLLSAARFDLVRPGIACYGLWPSRETRIAAELVHGESLELRAALTWKTRIVQIHEAPKGEYVGYGRTLRLGRPSRIALLPVGYYDGYDRGLSGTGEVAINGQRAPLAGRVCMNMCMVDTTDLEEVRVGDEVTLLGPGGPTAEELAAWLDTINYEVVTRIHERIPRVKVD